MSASRRSYGHGTGRQTLLGATVGNVLDRVARQWPNGQPLVAGGRDARRTWAGQGNKAWPLAARWKACGAGRRARFAVPAHSNFVDWFPMTGAGKVQEFVTRERMAEGLSHQHKDVA